MADDSSSIAFMRRKGRRGPLVLTNPDEESDLDATDSRSVWNPPPLPSPSYSEQSPLPPASYAQISKSYPTAIPLIPIIPDPPPSGYTPRSNPSNPSLSSPSGSSSPAVESTPPPSTPGHIAPSETGSTVTAERQNGAYPDDRSDARQHNAGRMSVMDRIRYPFAKPQKNCNLRQSPSPIITTGGTYTCSTQEPITNKVLLTVTADCEHYTYLEITGARDALIIKEKIFSKLQIPDDQQPFFSIYRTEIGSYAIGDALSDERLMEICREEGDGKGTLKLLAQHSSAQVHLTPPLPVIPNHVPPVLPYHGSFRSPSQSGKARSTRSNHETLSSASEPFPLDPVMLYEGSVSDDDYAEKEMNRHTIRPPAQASRPQRYGIPIPASPLVPPSNLREQSPISRRPLSPSRTNEAAGTSLVDRGRGFTTTPTSQSYSPSASYFDDSVIPPYPSRRHGHSASDATGERERAKELAERPYGDRDPRQNQRDTNRRLERRVMGQEPWVVVPSPKNDRPSTADAQRPTPSRSQPRSHAILPQIPSSPRVPPPVPSESGRQRLPGQSVPPHWFIVPGITGNGAPRAVGDQRQNRLSAAKSMESLRSITAQSKRSGIGMYSKEGNSSTTSFMNMDGRRDASSNTQSRAAVSPTSYGTPRPPPKIASHSSNDVSQIHGRPLPSQGQNLGSAGALLTPNTWRPSPEQQVPRPRSVLDDIGASPAPRKLPLPPGGWIGISPFPEQDDLRSPSMLSPHHPYITAIPARPSPSVSSSHTAVNTKISDGSGNTLTGSDVSDAQTVVIDILSGQTMRGLAGASSPDSPRRTPVEKRAEANSEATGAHKSFVSMTKDSPVSVYDGDNEGPGATIKPEVRSWIASQLANTSSSDGTLKAGEKGDRLSDKATPYPSVPSPHIMREDSSTSTITTRTTDMTDDGDDDDSDGYGDTDSLWKTPLKPQPSRPDLSAQIERPAITQPTRSPHHTNIPPNFPPPNFPLPPPPLPPHSPRRRNVKNEKNRSNRDSQFIKKSQNTWAYRPVPEEISERLDSWFPDHDLDKPVIDSSSSGGSSPTAVEPAVPGFQNSSADKDKKSRHKKSIRLVAAEQHKKKNERGSRSDSSTMSSIMRKRSTKLWGSKLEEVTTSQIPAIPPVPESPTAQNPKPIFKWVRGELIGKGTYGRVYLALNATTGEMIAVKQVEIPQTDADRDDKRQVSVVEALKLESETLKDLDHPNIVQYLGFEQTPDFLSIFLEYVPGGSVAGILRKHGKFEDQLTRSFTGQILDGLAYLHNHGIIHRDLKADNILVETSGICKISDFGIAKRTDDINENGIHTSMQGTVFWMAPEVVAAARKGEQHGYNGKVDIWSLGCVVLEMWAGRRPWQDVDAIAVIYELITTKGAPPVPTDVILGPDADDFRQKCFAIKPDERPSAPELRQHPYLVLQPGWTFTGFK